MRESETRTVGEIEESATGEGGDTVASEESAPLLPKQAQTKVPEIEVRLYRLGKGPIDVFKSALGGWGQDQLEVRDILDKYGFKSVFAFKAESGRGAPIRFNPRNGRSLLPYNDGGVICIDGEPKDSLLKPITKILLGVAFITFMIALVTMEYPDWMRKLNISGGRIPPWILACAVIVFTRMKKRTKDFVKNRSW